MGTGKDKICIELVPEKGRKLVSYKLSESVIEKLGVRNTTPPIDVLKSFVNDDHLFEELRQKHIKEMGESLPAFPDCAVCNKTSMLNEDKECRMYYLQMEITFTVATSVFVSILLSNRHIFADKKYLKKLSVPFLQSCNYVNGRGILWFDFTVLTKAILAEGFVSISEQLSANDTLSNLKVLNNSIDELETARVVDELYGRNDPFYQRVQKRFLESKRNYYLTALEIEKAEHKITPKPDNLARPDRTDIALWAYYMNETGYKLNEYHFPSLKSWEAIGTKFEKSAKNIQLKYNELRKTSDRINQKMIPKMEYIIEHMLTDYPNAKSLAADELKLAQLK